MPDLSARRTPRWRVLSRLDQSLAFYFMVWRCSAARAVCGIPDLVPY